LNSSPKRANNWVARDLWSDMPTKLLDPDVVNLAVELDGLPLALATARAYLDQTALSFSDYLRLYKTSWANLLQTSPELSSTERFTLHGSFHLNTNSGMNFRPSFFGFGHTLIIRIMRFFGMATQRTQSGYMSLPKMS
jgi:hypothetical protein